MAMTQTQINEAFAAMGLAPPSSALLASLEAIPDTYTALATIIQLPQVQTSVIPIVTMFDLALGHDPTSATLSSMVESNLSQAQLASDFVSSQAFANVYNGGVLLNPNTIVTSCQRVDHYCSVREWAWPSPTPSYTERLSWPDPCAGFPRVQPIAGGWSFTDRRC